MAGEHSAAHVAALVDHLPAEALVNAPSAEDSAWTLEACLLADIRNNLVGLIWGMSDPKKRGQMPRRVGPSWMTRDRMRKLEARVLTVDELKAELGKPRR